MAASDPRVLLVAAGLVVGAVGLLCGAALVEGGPLPGTMVAVGGGLYGGVALLALGAAVLAGPRGQRVVLWGLWIWLSTQALVQILALGRLIPGVSVREATPYGRVYWTKEGSHHGLLDGGGWHSHRGGFEGEDRRVVIIGDSFVEALEVRPADNLGARLEARMSGGQVVSLGRGATGPGHYLETLRHALAHHDPDHVVVTFFLGNDFTDSLGEEVMGGGPVERLEHELLYTIDPAGRIGLHPDSPMDPETWRARLAANRRLTPRTAARTLLSHDLLLGLGRDLWTRRAAMLAPPPAFGPGDQLPTMRIATGDPLRLSVALLQQAREIAAAADAQLSVVTVPHFPEVLYRTPADQVPELGAYGLLQDERALADALSRAGVPVLALGERIVRERRTVGEIAPLFFDGTGHLTPAGHQWVADELCAAFFSPCTATAP